MGATRSLKCGLVDLGELGKREQPGDMVLPWEHGELTARLTEARILMEVRIQWGDALAGAAVLSASHQPELW